MTRVVWTLIGRGVIHSVLDVAAPGGARTRAGGVEHGTNRKKSLRLSGGKVRSPMPGSVEVLVAKPGTIVHWQRECI